jgi:oligosaccharide repeat unit polymerase
MIENFDQLYIVLAQMLLVFAVLFLIYKKYIFSIFDPLFFFLITQAFSIVLAFLQIKDIGYLLNFICCQIFFTIGFILINPKRKIVTIVDDSNIDWRKNELKFWTYFTIVGFILIFIANLYLISKQGLIILKDDPTTDKVGTFETGGGIGAVRRINWGLMTLVSLSALYLYVKIKKKIFLIILIFCMLFSIAGGSKSSLLLFITIIALLGLFSTFQYSTVFKRINNLKIPILILGLLSAIFILIGKSSSGIEDALLGLGVRFLYFGDVILYYYDDQSVNHFQKLNSIDFFRYEFNPLLGLLRISDYLNPIGNDMVVYSFSHGEKLDVATGPNLPFYVKGHMFFGAFGAVLYSFIVGLIVGQGRSLIYNKHKTHSVLILILFLNLIIFSYPQDSALTFATIIDTLVFSIIPIIISLILIYEFRPSKN